MFKNAVFKADVDTVKWLKAAAVRAIKTVAQSMLSLIAVGTAIDTLDWKTILAVSATAGVISILTSIAGIPEVESDGE